MSTHPVLVLLQQALDQIRSLNVQIHPSPQHSRRLFDKALPEGCDSEENPCGKPIRADLLHEIRLTSSLQPLLEKGDALIGLALFEAAKRLAKCHVADNVEGDEVEPVSHVENRLGSLVPRRWATFPEPLHHQVDVALDDGLLLAQALLAETMAQLSSDKGVVVSRLGENIRREPSGAVKLGIFLKLLALCHGAIVVAVNVLPGFGRGIDQFVGRYSHNRAILVGNSKQIARPPPAVDANGARKSTGAVEERTRIVPERVEEKIVDDAEGSVTDQL